MFYCFVILSGITSQVIIPAAAICSRQISNMEVYDSEESCSSVSSSSYIFSASLDSQESSVDSYPRLPSKTVKKTRKRTPHILDKLYYREIRGNFASFPHAPNLKLFCQIPARCQIRLRNVLPDSALDSNHVFLGLSRCGQFLLSYTYTTELDVMTFNQVYKYRLHWWAFVPHQQVRKVSEVMLFGNQGVYSTLFIAVCQWPMDYSRILIYGNCQESYGQHTGTWSTSAPERSYLTITTVPSLNKCQDCLKVAASYEEEDLAASWDSCVRFSCLKHGLTLHTSFDVVSPFPKFEPTICMKHEGTVVFNTGNFLHVLRAELEHLSNSSTSVTKPSSSNSVLTSDTSETVDQNPSSVVSSASDNSSNIKQELSITSTDSSGRDCQKSMSSESSKMDDGNQETVENQTLPQNLRVYDTRSRVSLQRKQHSLEQMASFDLIKCPIPMAHESGCESLAVKQDDLRFCANNCAHKSLVSATSEKERHLQGSRVARVVEEDDYDDDIDDDVGASDDVISNSQTFFTSRGSRKCSEQDSEHFLLARHGVASTKNGSDEIVRIGSESRVVSKDQAIPKSSELSASESIFLSRSRPVMKISGKCSEGDCKKVLDSSLRDNQERIIKSETRAGHYTRDLEASSGREKALRDFRDGVFSGRITRSQTSRAAGRLEIADMPVVNELSKVDTEKVKRNEFSQISHASEKSRCVAGDTVWKEQGDFNGVCNKESRIMDSTQELNITCGIMNPSTSEEMVSSVTLMSPIPGTLLMVHTTEESESDDCQSVPDRRKEIMTPSSSKSRRIRGGATVKLSSPLPAMPTAVSHGGSISSAHNKIAEAEKAYEFTDDGLEPGCEKLSSFRRRRLADKKYEFCEEGEDAENIVPFRLTRRRELSPRLRSPPIYLSPSSLMLTHRRRHHDTLSDPPELVVSGPRSPQILASDIHSVPQTPNHLETDKAVLRPFNRNMAATLLLSPRDRDGSGDWVKTNNNRRLPMPDVVALHEHNPLDKPEHNLLENAVVQPGAVGNLGPVGAARMAKKEFPSPSLQSNLNGNSNTFRCTVQLKRRYIDVDDELVSVITDIEDDDFSESTGYHCALPLEVHGAGYAQLQMISNTKAGKLMAPCVLVHQRSFDVEQFCHEIAERLCIEAGKKYWFCNDYDVEIVDVCPFSGDVIAVALMRIQATIKTKGLAKSQRHPVSSMDRQQYQGSCKFVWNVDTGHYAVVWTRALREVDAYNAIEMDPWNPARDLAVKLRKDLHHVPMYQSVKTITNELVLKGVSLVRISDLENLTELTL